MQKIISTIKKQSAPYQMKNLCSRKLWSATIPCPVYHWNLSPVLESPYVQSAFLIFQCSAVQFIKLDLFPSQCRHIEILFFFNLKEFLLLSASKTSFSSMTSLPPSSASPVFGLVNKFNHFETKNSNHISTDLFNFILTNLNHSEFVFQTTKFNPYFTWFNRQKADPITKRLNQPGFFNHTIMN